MMCLWLCDSPYIKIQTSFESTDPGSVERLIVLMESLNGQNAFIGWLIFLRCILLMWPILINEWPLAILCYHLCPIEILACGTNFTILTYYARNERYPPSSEGEN